MNSALLNMKTENYAYAPLAYHDSWLSVDPIIGCRIDCQYCFMQVTGWTGVRPERLFTVPEIVDALVSHRYFIPHQTVLAFGNQTDPFLAENIDYTSSFFDALEKRELRNPTVAVTKKRIPEDFLDMAGGLRHPRPVFFISHSGLPKTIERGVNPRENQDNLRNLSERGMCVVHYWRPLTTKNGTDQALTEVLDLVAPYANASVYIGLKVTPALSDVYNRNPDLRLPQEQQGRYGDYIPEGVEERLRMLAAAKHPDYPLFKHASCATSYVLRMPDYTATLYRDPICKGSNCPVRQRAICEGASSTPTRGRVQKLLAAVGKSSEFTITKDAVEIDAEVSQEDYAYLLHNLNYPIKASVIRTRNLWGSIYRSGEQPSEKDSDSG